MQRLILALLTTLFLGACGGSGPSIEGTWKLSEASLAEVTKDAPPAALAMAKEAASKVTMTFADGKCTSAMPGIAPMEGTYEVKSSDGNKLTIEIETDGKKEESVVEVNGDEMTLELQGQKMTFVRQP